MTKTKKLKHKKDESDIQEIIKMKCECLRGDCNSKGYTYGIFIPFEDMSSNHRKKMLIEFLKKHIPNYFSLTAKASAIERLIKDSRNIEMLERLEDEGKNGED